MSEDRRYVEWLRKVAIYSNDSWLAREAREAYLQETGSEPLTDWELEILRKDDGGAAS